jgi:hypothetical protein
VAVMTESLGIGPIPTNPPRISLGLASPADDTAQDANREGANRLSVTTI